MQEAPEGEPDHTPEHELADPTPMLEAKAVSSKKAARSPGCTAQPQFSPSTRAKKQIEDISARVLIDEKADRARCERGAQSEGRCLDVDATQKLSRTNSV